jgi:Homeodomain-like domain
VNLFDRALTSGVVAKSRSGSDCAPVLAFLLYRLSCGLLRLLVRAGLDDRELEIAVLRHQLRVLTRGSSRPRYSTADRAFLAAASRFLPRERWSAFGVVPETLRRWRRQLEAGKGMRSRRGPGRPPIDSDLRQLILRMGRENPRWGYLRIKGELLQLGIRISATTIANVLRRGGLGPCPGGADRRGGSSSGPRPSPSCPPALPPPTCRIGLGASRALRLRRRMEQNHSRPTRRLAPRLLPVRIPPMISRSLLGKSSATPGCVSPSESRLRVAHHPAAGDLVTGLPLLPFVLSPDHGSATGVASAFRARSAGGFTSGL